MSTVDLKCEPAWIMVKCDNRGKIEDGCLSRDKTHSHTGIVCRQCTLNILKKGESYE